MNNYYVVRIDRYRANKDYVPARVDIIENVVLYGLFSPINRATPLGLQERQGLQAMDLETAKRKMHDYAENYRVSDSPIYHHAANDFSIGVEWRIGIATGKKVTLLPNPRLWYLLYRIEADIKKGGK